MIKLIVLFIVMAACGTEKSYTPPQTDTPVVDGPGQGAPGSPVAFSTVFNGNDAPGDKTCGGCHAGQPFITQKDTFCGIGLNWVRGGRMPTTGSIVGSQLHEQMEAVCL